MATRPSPLGAVAKEAVVLCLLTAEDDVCTIVALVVFTELDRLSFDASAPAPVAAAAGAAAVADDDDDLPVARGGCFSFTNPDPPILRPITGFVGCSPLLDDDVTPAEVDFVDAGVIALLWPLPSLMLLLLLLAVVLVAVVP